MTENVKTTAFPVVILAAGLSSRMGLMKPLLKFNETETFLNHILNEYEKFCVTEMVLVTNDSVFLAIGKVNFNNLKVVINKNPSLGRLSSIKIGINALKANDACFIHNIDNPYINENLIKKMASIVNDTNYVVPVYNGKGGHPILIGKQAIEQISGFKQNDADLREVLKPLKRENIETPDEKILCNINTAQDYQKFLNNEL